MTELTPDPTATRSDTLPWRERADLVVVGTGMSAWAFLRGLSATTALPDTVLVLDRGRGWDPRVRPR